MTEYYYGTESSDSYSYTGYDNVIAYGYGGDDSITGNWGDDKLYGLAGSDSLWGSYGNDYLDGYGYSYGEYDYATGGYGADTYAVADEYGNTQYAADGYWSYGTSDGYLTVTDYNYWEGDTIQLSYGDAAYYSSNSAYDYNNNGYADTALYYGNNLLAVISDTTSVNYSYV